MPADNNLRGVLDERKSVHVTDMRKGSLFDSVDIDGSGTIDKAEFDELYAIIQEETRRDIADKAAWEKKAATAKRRLKLAGCFAFTMALFLGLSVAANFTTMTYLLEESKETKVAETENHTSLTVKGTSHIVETAIAKQDVPLLIAPVLPMKMLSNVDSIMVKIVFLDGLNMTDPESFNSTTYREVIKKYTVTGFDWESKSRLTFKTVQGDKVEILDGATRLVLANGTAYGVCQADAECSSFEVGGVNVTEKLQEARDNLPMPVRRALDGHERKLQEIQKKWRRRQLNHKGTVYQNRDGLYDTGKCSMGQCCFNIIRDVTALGIYGMPFVKDDATKNFYKKFIRINTPNWGTPFIVAGSAKVSDAGLQEAALTFAKMTHKRLHLRTSIANRGVHFTVLAASERMTDVPEYAYLKNDGATDWDTRARGVGAIPYTKTVSCGEESALCDEKDPYLSAVSHTNSGTNICIHELAHTLAAFPDFDESTYLRLAPEGRPVGWGRRLSHAQRMSHFTAMWARGMFYGMAQAFWGGQNIYCIANAAYQQYANNLGYTAYHRSNVQEYWAEAVTSYFGANKRGSPYEDHDDLYWNMHDFSADVLTAIFFGDAAQDAGLDWDDHPCPGKSCNCWTFDCSKFAI